MKKEIKYLLIIVISFIFVLILMKTESFAGTQRLKNLKYDVTLNTDGTANITETWNIRVTDTNTLFKTFDLDSSKYGKIKNVKVREIIGDVSKEFENTKEYAYHIKKGGYYALNRSYKEFEIAWGVAIDGTETRTYQISYTITDVVKTYQDCSEFYWQFIGDINNIPADKVEGRVKVPSGITAKEDLKVWAHGPLNGNVEVIDNQTVVFEVKDLDIKTMVEIRIVTEQNIFVNNLNTSIQEKLPSILEQETKWANEANEQRRINNIKRILRFIVKILIFVIKIIILIIFGTKIIKYREILSKMEKVKPAEKYEYYREIPDKEATPAEAAFLYYYDEKFEFERNIAKIVSATILNLALKKVISFKKVREDEINIFLHSLEENNIEIKEDEKNIYNIFKEIYEDTPYSNTSGITMDDIKKYAKSRDKKFLEKIGEIHKIARIKQDAKGNYDVKKELEFDEWKKKQGIYFITGASSLLALIPMGIFSTICFIVASIICGILCNKIARKNRILTQKGIDEQEKWKALKRYMEEYSMLKEREVLELGIWEKYLVYATAFGIGQKVIKQLKITYPELSEENYVINNDYSCLCMKDILNIDRIIESGIQRAYTAGMNSQRMSGNYSSDGGRDGGGYSSRRWTAAVAFLVAAEAGGGRSVGMGGR